MRRLLLLLLIACGGGSPAPAPALSGPPAPLVATPAGASDVVVATVNGKPVYGSCVTTQAARGATRQQALDECIDFELLAQSAVAYASDPEVVLATRTALVSEVIAREYEQKFTRSADFGEYYIRSVDRNRSKIVHGEARASAYLRVPLAKTATPAEDAAAKALAEELASVLAKERGLMAPHLDAFGKQIIGTRGTLEFAVVPPYLDSGGLVPEYAKPLFAVPEVGRTTGAVRTTWGWDVILLTDLIPAANPTPEEIAKQALPEVKRSYFPQWATQVGQKLGVSIKIYDDQVPKLEDL
jgi:PPIC-type PPIASE domain